MSCKPTETELTFCAALELATTIDHHLHRGTKHYYSKGGRLLVELDEVVRAILEDQLATGETKCRIKNKSTMNK